MAFYQLIRNTPDTQAGLNGATTLLSVTTPIVDGPDAALRAALPDIEQQVAALHPEARELALAGIQFFAETDAKRREEFSQTLIKLAALVLALFFILLLALVVLVKFYRRGQRATHDNQVVRSRFEAAVSSSLDAVLVVDTDGKIVEFNGAAETVFGYERAEALGADMAELIVPEHLRQMHHAGMKRFSGNW